MFGISPLELLIFASIMALMFGTAVCIAAVVLFRSGKKPRDDL